MQTLAARAEAESTHALGRQPGVPVGVRRYDLDWLRALVVLGLIPFHTAVIFQASPDAYLKDAQTSVVLAILGAFGGVWGMPLLFLVAGAGTWFALKKRTPARFVGERASRLLVPFVVATLVIVPIQVYFVLKGNPGLMRSFHVPFAVPQHALDSYPSFYGQFLWAYGYFLTHFSPGLVPVFWGHMWFIPRLFAYSLLSLPLFLYLRQGAGRRVIDGLADACSRPGVILLLGLPLVLVEAGLRSGWLNALTAHWPLYDDWSQFFFYFVFFVCGYILYADARFVKAIERHTWVALGLGVIAYAAVQAMSLMPVSAPVTKSLDMLLRLPLRGVLVWFWIVAVLGLASRFINVTSRAQRYLNEATYPIYVLHMPILTVIGYLALTWTVGIALKFSFIVAATFLITLIVYELLVRRIPVMRFLLGAKRMPTPPASAGVIEPGSALQSVGRSHDALAESLKGLTQWRDRLAHVQAVRTSIQAIHKAAVRMEHAMSTLSTQRTVVAHAGRAPLLTGAGARGAQAAPPALNLAQMFRARSVQFGDAIRWRQRVNGSIVSMTWHENAALVTELIAGLDALGVHKGDSVGILSGTRWEWMAADWAILGLGGVTVTIYPTNVAETVEFMLNDADVRYLFLEDRSQYEKVLSIRDKVPGVKNVILFADGEELGADPWAMSFAELREFGRQRGKADRFAAERANAIRRDDPATIVYTSGTTGRPKGVVLTHASLLAQCLGARDMLTTLRPGMVDLLFLPLAHVLGREEHVVGIDQGLETFITEDLSHLAGDFKTVRPQVIIGVPRVFEKVYAAFQQQVAVGNSLTRGIARWAMRVGIEFSRYRERQETPPWYLTLTYAVADRLVFRRVRAALGGRIEFAISGGAPLDPDVLDFFLAAGVLLLEGWGLTETGGALAVNRVEEYRRGTVGRIFHGHQVRIAPDGEILVRGPCVFSHYHRNAEETAAAFDQDGWFLTGDIGSVDADGFLRITDRKKDLIATAGGKKIAPQEIERLLGSIPVVSHAAVFGDRRPYLVALLTLDEAAVQLWARKAGIESQDVEELMADPRLRAYLDLAVNQMNTHLARYETVKRYAIVPQDFTIENGLLTPSLKIRRRQIQAAYQPMIDALYKTGAQV
jgi:long-chain acyl-CoA synthetase